MTEDSDVYELSDRHNRARSEKYPPGWTEGDVERMVTRVARRVMDNFYEEVGRSIVRRILQYVGWAGVIGLTWLGVIKAKMWLS